MFGVGGNKPMIDMLFEFGEIKPCIMAFITYYMNQEGDYKERVLSGMVPAGDGYWHKIKGNYYNGNSRRHHSPDGNEVVCTWNIFHHDFEYFRWYAPMSGHCRAGKPRTQPVSQEEVSDFLTAPFKANPDLSFFIFSSCGNPYANEMKVQMKYITKPDRFSHGKDFTKNNIFFVVSDYYHTDFLVPYYFRNSLEVLFKKYCSREYKPSAFSVQY